VAGGAIAADAIVIEDRREKRRRIMAEVTILGGRYMVHRRILTDGVDAIMTTGAIVRNTGVIEHPGGKGAGVMAYATILGGGNMRCWLTDSRRTVVAGCAIASDVLVSED
jgi:hypothetical protein